MKLFLTILVLMTLPLSSFAKGIKRTPASNGDFPVVKEVTPSFMAAAYLSDVESMVEGSAQGHRAGNMTSPAPMLAAVGYVCTKLVCLDGGSGDFGLKATFTKAGEADVTNYYWADTKDGKAVLSRLCKPN